MQRNATEPAMFSPSRQAKGPSINPGQASAVTVAGSVGWCPGKSLPRCVLWPSVPELLIVAGNALSPRARLGAISRVLTHQRRPTRALVTQCHADLGPTARGSPTRRLFPRFSGRRSLKRISASSGLLPRDQMRAWMSAAKAVGCVTVGVLGWTGLVVSSRYRRNARGLLACSV